MGSVTIRNIDDAVKRNARLTAAANGRSLEAELRALLERTYCDPALAARRAAIQRMSGKEFVDHLIGLTRPGLDDDPFQRERVAVRDINL